MLWSGSTQLQTQANDLAAPASAALDMGDMFSGLSIAGNESEEPQEPPPSIAARTAPELPGAGSKAEAAGSVRYACMEFAPTTATCGQLVERKLSDTKLPCKMPISLCLSC